MTIVSAAGQTYLLDTLLTIFVTEHTSHSDLHTSQETIKFDTFCRTQPNTPVNKLLRIKRFLGGMI